MALRRVQVRRNKSASYSFCSNQSCSSPRTDPATVGKKCSQAAEHHDVSEVPAKHISRAEQPQIAG